MDGELSLAGVKVDLTAVADEAMPAEAVEPVDQKAFVKGVFACHQAAYFLLGRS